jgi:hypothetical protein
VLRPSPPLAPTPANTEGRGMHGLLCLHLITGHHGVCAVISSRPTSSSWHRSRLCAQPYDLYCQR